MEMLEQAKRLQKQKRVKDRDLLDEIKKRPCIVCGTHGSDRNPIDPSHIRSRGAGGPDEEWNVVPKCRSCHIAWGRLGANTFCDRNPRFKAHLESLGWYWNGPRMSHPKLERGRA